MRRYHEKLFSPGIIELSRLARYPIPRAMVSGTFLLAGCLGEATLANIINRPDSISSGSGSWILWFQRTRGGAIQQEFALACVLREGCGALELRACLVEAAELGEEVAAHTRQEVVALKRWLRSQRIDQFQARCRAGRHGDRDRTVQLHDG